MIKWQKMRQTKISLYRENSEKILKEGVMKNNVFSGSLNSKLLFAGAVLALAFGSNVASAQEGFADKLDRVLREHQLARMVEADVATAAAQVDIERAAYFPKLTTSVSAGTHHIRSEQGVNGHFDPMQAEIAINQLITDFGLTSSRVTAANVVLDKEEMERELQLQNLTLAAVEAQLQLIQASHVVKFAEQSESNIKRQTSLESARMEAGRGYATDVLQAKAQLAGAEARRVSAQNRFREAVNRYRVIFGERPFEIEELELMSIPVSILPMSEDAIVEAIRTQNPDLIAAIKRAEVTLAERNVARNRELLPRVSLRVSSGASEELDGALGRRYDNKAIVSFDWQFDLGFRAKHVTESADQSVASAQQKADYVHVQAIEEGRNAWSAWQSARERSEFLNNQVQLASNFLELARKERELGRRSLVDILNGEISLINAQSDATAAKIDEIIAAYRLMRATGVLTPDLFSQTGILVPANQVLSASN